MRRAARDRRGRSCRTSASGAGLALLVVAASLLGACGDPTGSAQLATGSPGSSALGSSTSTGPPTTAPPGSAGPQPAPSTTRSAAVSTTARRAPTTSAAPPTSVTPTTAPGDAACRPGQFAFTVTTDKAVYVVGEEVLFTPRAVNQGAPCSYGPYHRWHYTATVAGQARPSSWIGGFSFDRGTVATGGTVTYSFGPSATVDLVGVNRWDWSTESFGAASVSFEVRAA